MKGVLSLWFVKVFPSNKQIIGSWKEIKIYVYYSFKNFSIKLVYVMLLNIGTYFLESQVTGHDVKAGFLNFSYTLSSGW
jgi:hypothetical protein